MSLGMMVMLNMLSGNAETVDKVKSAIGKKIESVILDEENNRLKFIFTDGTTLNIWDDGQSCCEDRYMRTDDDLTEYASAILLDFELKDASAIEDDYGVHEVQFLDVKTDKGVFQIANHNEHNGYYGGFSIRAN